MENKGKDLSISSKENINVLFKSAGTHLVAVRPVKTIDDYIKKVRILTDY